MLRLYDRLMLPFLQSIYEYTTLQLHCVVRVHFIVCQTHWSFGLTRAFVYRNSQI